MHRVERSGARRIDFRRLWRRTILRRRKSEADTADVPVRCVREPAVMERRFRCDTVTRGEGMPVFIPWAVPAAFVVGGLTSVLVK